MVRVIVRHPVTLHGLVNDPSGTQVIGEGLDTLDPTVTLTPVVRAAFACGSNRVDILGAAVRGSFALADNWVEVEQRNGRLVAQHYSVYEFAGWQNR